jgi:hypothetical protein
VARPLLDAHGRGLRRHTLDTRRRLGCVKANLARSQNLCEEIFLRLCVDRLRAAGVSAIWLCDRGFHRVA